MTISSIASLNNLGKINNICCSGSLHKKKSGALPNSKNFLENRIGNNKHCKQIGKNENYQRSADAH